MQYNHTYGRLKGSPKTTLRFGVGEFVEFLNYSAGDSSYLQLGVVACLPPNSCRAGTVFSPELDASDEKYLVLYENDKYWHIHEVYLSVALSRITPEEKLKLQIRLNRQRG